MAQPSGRVVPIKKAEAAGGPGEYVEQALYEVRRAIYPRAVHGWFARWRWALVWATQIVFYGTAWLQWNGRQAVLFDIVQRKFYVFGLVFWPQDIVYLTVLLVISALALFLFTAVAGRLWCGYACPQTVYTEIFLWIERKFEGDRNARMRLDAQGWNPEKVRKKFLKHLTWILLSLWTGFTFVGYFTPIRELGDAVLGVAGWGAGVYSVGPWEGFWMLFYGFATYGNAGWMREQVCTYMCPYARFQSAMFDKDTLIITYDQGRGEPRGKGPGRGDCVDCGICVQVCPTGIDIRDGLQYQCIGCAACIDGCDQVMDKVGRPRGLIRYSTTHAMEGRPTRVLRFRVVLYSAILLAVTAAALVTLYHRVPLKVDVIRDRVALAREVEGGQIENVYRLQVMNTVEQPREFEIRVEGPGGVRLASAPRVSLGATESRMFPVRVRVDPGALAAGTHGIAFAVSAADDAGVAVREKSVFLVR